MMTVNKQECSTNQEYAAKLQTSEIRASQISNKKWKISKLKWAYIKTCCSKYVMVCIGTELYGKHGVPAYLQQQPL